MPSDRRLSALYPSFREKVERVLAAMNAYAAKNMPGYTWKVIEGYRTAKYQNELYQKGRTRPGSIVTFKDGYTAESNHQSSLAVDIAPMHGYDVEWGVDSKHWDYLGHCYRAEGLTWGGSWENLRDMPHGEWPTSDKTTYLDARKWQRQNGLRHD